MEIEHGFYLKSNKEQVWIQVKLGLATFLDGRERSALIIGQYLEGLVKLIDQFQKDNSENLIVRGTSYILNKRTAKKIGFQVVQTDFLQRCILIYNYFNLVCVNSLAKGKLTFPKLEKFRPWRPD